MPPKEVLARKVLIYATTDSSLLVFDEPAFPDMPLQVPGGTIEPGESAYAAALREFLEETGLSGEMDLRALGESTYAFAKNNVPHRHFRSFFHVDLPSGLPDCWEHYEKTPDGGGVPILFRFSWLAIDRARTKLGFDMGALLYLVRASRA